MRITAIVSSPCTPLLLAVDQQKYINVDDLQAQTSLEEAARKCGVDLTLHGGGRQIRIDCAFGCPGDHAGKREISVDIANPQKVFCCHAYACGMRGNLLSLMHGWLTGARPPGDRLKGEEFKRVRDVLVGKAGEPVAHATGSTKAETAPAKPRPERNPPLCEHQNEKARELVTMHEKFVIDVAKMPPAAASYVRRHSCLTPEVMCKWRVGVLPLDGGGDKRGWSLRGQVIYPIDAEDGQVLGYVARDPAYEAKQVAFDAMTPAQRLKERQPAKHRFPTDFQRGLELFGQSAARLLEPGYRERIARLGVVVVEGFNDVIGLDALGVPVIGLMSNKITEAQVAKVERWAKRLSGNRVTLLFDADEAGDAGAKEALWRFSQRGVEARLGWTRGMHDGRFAGRQPESLDRNELHLLFPTLSA